MTGAIDTHAHVQFPQFDEDRGPMLEECWRAGIEAMIVVGTDIPSSHAAVELATTDPRLFATAGVHPHDASDYDGQAEEALRTLAHERAIVALGEMGLDFYRNLSPRAAQEEALGRQLALAAEFELPVVIHTREAVAEATILLREWTAGLPEAFTRPYGVMHCYSGTVEQAHELVGLGFLVSIPATITYPRNDVLRHVAAAVPAESLVLETDSPYLPPQSRRGQRNDPRHTLDAAATVAEVRGQPQDEIVRITTSNARRLLRL